MGGKLPDSFRNAYSNSIIQHILLQRIAVFVSRENLVSHLGTQFPAQFTTSVRYKCFSPCDKVPFSECLGILGIPAIIAGKYISIGTKQVAGLQIGSQMKL